MQLCDLTALRHSANHAEATSIVATESRSTAPEQIQAGFAKSAIHKAIRYGITAGRRVGQQLQVGNGFVAERLVDQRRVEEGDGVDDVEWRPANEEFENDDEQHFDDAFLVLEALFGVRSGVKTNGDIF